MADDIVSVLDTIVNALNRAGVSYAICGGLAVNLHGHVRATRDIDILVQRDDLGSIRELLVPLGFTFYAGPIPFGVGTDRERELHRVSRTRDGDLLTVDLLVVTNVLQPAWESRIRATWRERDVWVVSRDGLGHMKRLAGRAQDLADLESLGIDSARGRDDGT